MFKKIDNSPLITDVIDIAAPQPRKPWQTPQIIQCGSEHTAVKNFSATENHYASVDFQTSVTTS